ncbi:MAG: adenylate/guanylate cyclase domain-containing protein [Gallionellaceae bacterium]
MNAISQVNIQHDKAVLFADVSGSTQLYEILGDTRAFAAINQYLDILRKVTVSHQGRVVKSIGDEIMAVFPDPVCAVQAACEMQLLVNAQPPIEHTRVTVRIGFHFGAVLESPSDGDVFGDTVNVASRMSEIAKSQQIISTSSTVAMLPPILRSSTRPLKAPAIKGKAEDISVSEVIWQASDDMTMMVGNTFIPNSVEPILQLTHQGKKILVNAQHPSLTIGRDELADFVVQDRRASRIHAKIERRRDKFVFIDISSNGSYVTVNDETEIELHREEITLRDRGNISLGHPFKKDPSEVIEFVLLNS